MPVNDRLVELSFRELGTILGKVAEYNKAGGPGAQPAVLIGGWAVYVYNDYYGSVDIDLVTNADTRKSLGHWLTQHHGYAEDRTESRRWLTLRKGTPPNEIVVEFARRESDDFFMGRTDKLNFSILDGHTVERTLERIPVLVPSRSLLVLFKLKAAYDWSYRVDRNQSRDPVREKAKVIKDRSDILALLDPDRGGHEVDISFLGAALREFPFLLKVLRWAGDDPDAAAKYEMSQRRASSIVGDTIQLVS